jgi:hypothetical protein
MPNHIEGLRTVPFFRTQIQLPLIGAWQVWNPRRAFQDTDLVQTRKIRKRLPIVLIGTEFWNEVTSLEGLTRYGTIRENEVKIRYYTDSIDDAFDFVTRELIEYNLKAPRARL